MKPCCITSPLVCPVIRFEHYRSHWQWNGYEHKNRKSTNRLDSNQQPFGWSFAVGWCHPQERLCLSLTPVNVPFERGNPESKDEFDGDMCTSLRLVCSTNVAVLSSEFTAKVSCLGKKNIHQKLNNCSSTANRQRYPPHAAFRVVRRFWKTQAVLEKAENLFTFRHSSSLGQWIQNDHANFGRLWLVSIDGFQLLWFASVK